MKTLYAAFDIFPNTKGSATHIAQTLEALAKRNKITFICLGNTNMPGFQVEGDIEINRCLALHPNFLKRGELYMEFITDYINNSKSDFNFVHFRDIFSALPLLQHKKLSGCKKIFEINAIPSIEIPFNYPMVYKSNSLLSRLKHIEDYCFHYSDHIITISNVTKDYLISRKIIDNKISVIPNMAEAGVSFSTIPKEYNQLKKNILYSGTLSPWQGLPVLLKALKYLERDDINLHLACSTKKNLPVIRKMIKKFKLDGITTINLSLPREKLYEIYHKAYLSVAPLTRCDRNEIQGCSPLKILESMAVQTPVIASDLRVCREIINHKKDGWLFNPDSPRSLANALEILLNNPELTKSLGENAKIKIDLQFNKKIYCDRINEVYNKL